MSPWIENLASCEHPDRPEPQAHDKGRTWECGSCGRRWMVHVFDVGHPPEVRGQATAVWRRFNGGNE